MSHPRSYATGKPAKQLDAEYRAWMDAKPMVVRCALCPWSFDGTAGECREQAAEHRAADHPEIRRKRRPRAPVSRFNPGKDEHRDEGKANAAEVAEMHRRREEAA